MEDQAEKILLLEWKEIKIINEWFKPLELIVRSILLKYVIIFLISQLYVELTGTEEQPTNVPATVHLRIRHLSGSYFRAGDDEIKEFRQPLGSFRKIKFRRTAISDETRCREEERKGNSMFKEISGIYF